MCGLITNGEYILLVWAGGCVEIGEKEGGGRETERGEGEREREREGERGGEREGGEREGDRKSTRLNSSHVRTSRMPSSA